MTRRLKIWVLFTNRPVISKFRGDVIGECRIIQSLSQHFDVYYNGKLVSDEDMEFGQGAEVDIPRGGYDLYYVRANPDLFRKLPHPKICMAYPYDKKAFDCADGLVVTTEIWRKGLLNKSIREKYYHFFDKWYPKEINIQNKIIKFNQICDPFISPSNTDQAEVDNWKERLTNTTAPGLCGRIRERLKSSMTFGLFGGQKERLTDTTTFGFYGRLDADTLPYTIIDSIHRYNDRALVVFAGLIRRELKEKGGVPKRTMYLGELPYDQMPSLIGATSYVLAAESPQGHVLGSNKILDAIAMGVPVLSMRNPVREEYLGQDYPLLFENKNDVDEGVFKLMYDDEFRKLVSRKTETAAAENHITAASLKTKHEIEAIFS